MVEDGFEEGEYFTKIKKVKIQVTKTYKFDTQDVDAFV